MILNYEDEKLDVLMSIKPVYVKEIKLRNKKYEFRKRIFKKNVRNIYIYESYPTKKVIGFFPYEGYLCDMPLKVWDICKKNSGIDKDSFLRYFNESSVAYALKINYFIPFETPLDPNSVFPAFKAPQSYMYIPKGCLDK